MNIVETSLDLPCDSFTISDDEVTARIEAMHIQECNTYYCSDYLKLEFESSPDEECIFQPEIISKKVDAPYREKISKWCFEIADFCQIDHETVGIAMSYLDRFLSTESGIPVLRNRKKYQQATVTTLYIAVKVFEREVIEPRQFAIISRGRCTESDITDMEMIILSALKWRVQPPTSISFVRHFLALLTSFGGIGRSVVNNLSVLSQLQTEIAVNDYYFVTVKPSQIAVASILNSIDGMPDKSFSKSVRCAFIQTLKKHGIICPLGREMKEVQDRLLVGFAEIGAIEDDQDQFQRDMLCGLACARQEELGIAT
uniref:Cyclin-like domain-containing protein n=1 Tax=Helicotheca tamesis TaxID=374047 RepID=A0A7S2HDW8_9STRA|mmetsp:Transcript_17276/g.23791  ORF Transcript_17276/g.23791 Transcript_17276/m.23791 type:complete len:313 (+) Transcript_17276:116-1054(+)